ncbi:MAG: hypothetical protein D6743_10275 [Calditrichaeota bacterium]|nr:MAG: hypothetical protein D6743_10275 [Calditrichota bacterium]
MAGLKKREKILMSVAGGLALFFAVNQFVCGQRRRPAAPAPPAVASESVQKPATAPAKKEKKKRAASPKRKAHPKYSKVTFTSWGRDPFAETFRLAKFDSSQTDSGNFVLRGIIWKDGQGHALISDQILGEGERSGDLKILHIRRDRVVCRKGGRIVTLLLRENGR